MSCLRFSKRLFFSCQLGRRKSEVTKVYGAERVSLLIPMYLRLLTINRLTLIEVLKKIDKFKYVADRFSSRVSLVAISQK